VKDDSYHLRGACRSYPPDWWWPDGPLHEKLRHEAAALTICRDCPVRGLCLQDALENEETEGIWGGTTPSQREAMLSHPDERWHGTFNGYNHHGCRCPACMEANRRRTRERSEQKRLERQGVAPSKPAGRIIEGAPHGTASGYNFHKCRCAECRAYLADKRRGQRERRRQAAAS